MMEIKRICVYCASSTQISHSYFEAAYELGQRMARLGIGLVNGAGNMGLMQASALSLWPCFKEMADAAESYINKAKVKASAYLQAAETEAEERKQHILDSAQTEIGELVISAAQKLLSDTVTPERDRELYDAFIRIGKQETPEERKPQ